MALRKNVAPSEHHIVVVRPRGVRNWLEALADSRIPTIPRSGITSIHNASVFFGKDGRAPHTSIARIQGNVKPGQRVIVSIEPN